MRASIAQLLKDTISDAPPSLADFKARLQAAAAEPRHEPLDFYPLMELAIFRESAPLIRALADAGAPLNRAPVVQLTPLATAMMNNSTIAFQALIQAGADPDGAIAFGCPSCLENAIGRAQPHFAAALLQAGANALLPDANGKAPIFHAVYHGDEATLAALLVRGADPLADHGAGSALSLAQHQQRQGCVEIIEAYLEAAALADSLPRPAPSRAPAL